MDYIIDIQGFRDGENKFLPKEVSVVSLQGNVVGHWIIIPPCEFDDLPHDIKTTNDYISTRLLGIQWFDGDITLRKLRYHFYNIARNASRIYVRGAEKARYVASIMARTVINIEEYTTEGFTDLRRKFKCEQVCCFHGCGENAYKSEYCAMQKAHLLREWLRSLLPEEARTNLPRRSSEIIYESLQKLIYNKRHSFVRFGADLACRGRDKVDGENDDDDEDSDTDSSDYESAEGDRTQTQTVPLPLASEEKEHQHEHQRNNEGSGRGAGEDHRSIRCRPNSKCNDDACRNCV